MRLLRLWLVAAGWGLGLSTSVLSSEQHISPLQDDASLHSVQAVGRQQIWAVGDRGVIWHSADAGQSWEVQPSGTRGRLHSVCFLTNTLGWVAGEEYLPGGFSRGVLLTTQDGGLTWQPLAAQSLPPLRCVRFFDLDRGVAVGAATPTAPTGVYRTEDGGQSWTPQPGPRAVGWQTASFLDPEMGLVGGQGGQLMVVTGDQLLPSRLPPVGTRTIRGVHQPTEGPTWLVGDGGLVLLSESGGVAWEEPATPLPDALRRMMDFRAVTSAGTHVWIAGSPGSVIWHSPNSGRTWEPQATGQRAPLNALAFASAERGLAVGEFGAVLSTIDGGRSWQPLRGTGREAAFLTLQARAAKISPSLFVKYSAEQGYRGVAWSITDSTAGLNFPATDLENRLTAAVVEAGGSAAGIAWQFPLQMPEADRNSKLLIKEWQQRTEGKLSETLLTSLVRELRMWRPRVLVLDQAGEDDAVVGLLQDAARQAILDAANPDRYLALQQLTGLEPWKVERIYVRLADGSQGQSGIDPYEFLYHTGSTVVMAGAPVRQMLGLPAVRSPARETYRLLTEGEAGQDLFAGLSLAPGSASRRGQAVLRPEDDVDLAKKQEQARRQRNYASIAEQTFDDPKAAAQSLAQMNDLIGGLPAEQGAATLAQYWEEHRRRGRLELAEAVGMEMLRRFPEQPATHEVSTWLIALWTSSEMTWQRTRQRGPAENAVVDRGRSAISRIQKVSGIADEESRTGLAFNGDALPSPAADRDMTTNTIDRWRRQAIELAQQMETQSPLLYARPEIQLPMAAHFRLTNAAGKSDLIYRQFGRATPGDPWRQVATRELWLSQPQTITPPQLARVAATAEAPFLDGLLSDPCWQTARELRLIDARTPSSTARELQPDELPQGEQAATGSDHGFVLLAYDRKFLYLAASLPQSLDLAEIRPETSERKYDADLSGHDRLSLHLDLDRDYGTAYALEIDQRGWTNDRCWEERQWNPRWFVAVDADSERWRIEAAIPWEELTATPPGRGTAWAAAITRTIPGSRLESWVTPSEQVPTAASYGIVRFE